jgi:N-acetyl sugar amidotransferase
MPSVEKISNLSGPLAFTLTGTVTDAVDYRQCTRCVMDTTDREITFDEDGNCCHCTAYLNKRGNHSYKGETSDRAFRHLLESIRRSGKNARYDCVVGISGGVDSSYLAYLAVHHGLRPLAVHLDNGWDSEKAVLNIRNVTSVLGMDYESYVLDWEEFRDLQLAFLKASVPEAETPTDVAIPAALHYHAAKHGIKYILSGGNLATEGILPKLWHYDVKDLKYFTSIHRQFGRLKLKQFPTFGYRTELYYKLVRRIKTVYPLNLVPYEKDNATELLEKKFDWTNYGQKHHESRYTKFIQSYYLYEKFGIDYRRVGCSLQICNGEIDRNQAIEKLKSRPYDPDEIEQEKYFVAKKLGVTKPELDKIIDAPPKWYCDYPHDEKKLAVIYDTYRRIYRKEKLDRF